MKSIILMIKPTDNCNLRCKYCYHSEYIYSPDIMDIKIMEEFIQKAIGDYDSIKFIWHGGEPLLAGKDFYAEATAIQNLYQNANGLRITNAIQTNGTLLTEEYIEELNRNGYSLGFSYDGFTNELMRGSTIETIRGIHLVETSGKKISTIKVMLKKDLDNILDVYNFYNDNNYDVRLNPLFDCELVEKNSLLYSAEEYSVAMEVLFHKWVDDENCNIRLFPFENFLSLLTTKYKRDCSNSSCLTKFLSINFKGDIYACSRYFPEHMMLGNINNINRVKDIYNSVAFNEILTKAVSRRQKCMDSCDLFSYCQGGCNHDAYIEGGIENNNFFSCKVFKLLFPMIQEYVQSLGDISLIKNKEIRKYFL